MESLPEVVTLVSATLMIILGTYLIIIIVRVYSLYRALGFSRTVLTPFPIVEALFAFVGISELLETVIGESGRVVHSLFMLVTVVFLLLGLHSYHEMLMKAEESKRLLKQTR